MHESSKLTRLALGQPGVLGSLYDIRSDNVLPGCILKSIQPPKDCVRVLQTPRLTYKCAMEDTVEEKLQNLDISAELSVSILGGLLDCSLAANYIMKKSSNSRSQSASVTCSMQTCTENLKLENIERGLLNLMSLDIPDATHVICGVEWGARTVIEAKTTTVIAANKHRIGDRPPLPHAAKDIPSVPKKRDEEPEHTDKDRSPSETGTVKPETSANDTQEQTRESDSCSIDRPQKNGMLGLKVRNEAGGALSQVLKRIGRVDASANLRFEDDSKLHATEVEFTIFSDVADFSRGSLPTDHEGVLSFLQSVPSNLEKVNNGKGIPLAFELVPISTIARMYGLARSADIVLNQLDHGLMRDVIRTLDKLMVTIQHCADYEAFVRAHLFCIPKAYHKTVNKNLRAAEGAKENFHKRIREALRSIRFEEGDIGQIEKILEEYREDEPDEADHDTMLEKYRDKAEFADNVKEQGAKYLKFGAPKLQDFLASGDYEDVYVFHFSEEMRGVQDSTWMENRKKLFELLDNMALQECVVVMDYDVEPNQVQKKLTKPFIEQWRGGKRIVPDVVEDLRALAKECLIKCDDATKADRTRKKEPPSSKRIVRLRCPGTHCFGQRRRHKWVCPRCREHVFYGFDDDYLYCRCSRYPFASATFKCSNQLHGREWTKPDTVHLGNQLRALEVAREYNILLLGETGVGKSTFINAFRNYLDFDSLEEAISDREEIHYVVPAYFDVEEEVKDYQRRGGVDGYIDYGRFTFSVGEESPSEQFSKRGESSTRRSKIYSFAVDDLVIRFIDTPGIGDTRGKSQDKANVRNILATLESIDRLSGVMFLLKANETRNTPAFSYYMKELICHLHIDASKNILFGFTHSAPGGFRLGATKAPLDAVLAELNLQGIRNDDTQFFFDSDVFNFIVKTRKNPTSHFNRCPNYQAMWDESTEQVYRLIEKVEDLPVHEVRKTLYLNRTRDFLEALPKPLTEFASSMKTSKDGVKKFQEKLAALNVEDENLAQELSKLNIPITYKEKEDLPHRRVVCGHKDCDGWTACHDKCDITAPDGVQDIASIQGCKAFRKYLVRHYGMCRRCNHPSSDHMMLSYRMVEKQRPLNNDEIHKCQAKRTAKADSREGLHQEQELAVKVLAQLREEEDQISAAQVVVGTYLGTSALGPSEDMLVKYLRSQIHRAQATSDDVRAKELKEQLAQYTARMQEAKDQIDSGQSFALTEKHVDDAVNNLKGMVMFGPYLAKTLGAERVALEEQGIVTISCKDGSNSKGLRNRFWRL